MGLRWSHIKTEDGKTFIDVDRALDKAGYGYEAYLNDKALDVLEKWRKQSGGNGYVFKHNGKPIKSIKTAWGGLMKRAGLKNFRFHDLRHTFGTRLVKKTDIKTVKELMGHRRIETTMGYIHSDDETKQKAVEDAFA